MSDIDRLVSVEAAEVLPTFKELIAEGVVRAYETHGYYTSGEPDDGLVEDVLYGLASEAKVAKLSERGTKACRRSQMMAATWTQVPSPDEWADQDDPLLAAGIYNKLNTISWRMLDANYGGKIQKRLNSDLGMVLCRTTAMPDKAQAFYVTTDPKCIREDLSLPSHGKEKRAVSQHAKNLAMIIERLPEHARLFRRELDVASTAALNAGRSILDPVFEAAQAAADENEE